YGDAMVHVAVDGAATYHATVDDDTIGRGFGPDAQGLQSVGHDLDAVGFLDPQLLGAAQHGTPFGTGCSNEQRREFVDGQRHLILGNLDALERRVTHADIRHRLAADFAFVAQSDIRPHGPQNVDHANAGGVDA